jgi:adenine/guanine phosphoribosyltransferase-like PRPP-binding protein
MSQDLLTQIFFIAALGGFLGAVFAAVGAAIPFAFYRKDRTLTESSLRASITVLSGVVDRNTSAMEANIELARNIGFTCPMRKEDVTSRGGHVS